VQKFLLVLAAIVVVIVAVAASSSGKPAATSDSGPKLPFLASTPSSSLIVPSTQAARTTSGTQATTTSATLPTTMVTEETTVPGSAEVKVVQVIDGDTIKVVSAGDEEDVRLIGIDAAEKGEDFSVQATQALEKLVGGATVHLEMDVEQRDQYDRLLAYVWVGGAMANEELLKQGLVTVYTVSPNVKYVDRFKAAQDAAQAAEIGLWGNPIHSPLQIVTVRYNPPGDDTKNLNEEYITFKVLVSGTLLGYSIEDQTGHRYHFPDQVFKKGDIFKLHSGEGADTQTDLYWGASGAAIWNNDGDTVKVLDPEDQIVASYDF
jgi:micrococcal nuclease